MCNVQDQPEKRLIRNRVLSIIKQNDTLYYYYYYLVYSRRGRNIYQHRNEQLSCSRIDRDYDSQSCFCFHDDDYDYEMNDYLFISPFCFLKNASCMLYHLHFS